MVKTTTRSKKKAAKRTAKRAKTPAKKAAARKRASTGRAKSARSSTRKKSAAAKASKPAAKKLTARKPAAKASAARRPAGSNSVPAIDATPLAKPARGMSPSECEPFRRLLLQKRSEMAGDVTTLQREALNRNRQDAAGDLSNMPIHMADLGSDNYEQEFTLGLIEGEREVLREIDDALRRIEEGTYGVCVATGRPIGKARLKAKPWARYCYEYTLAQEKGQKGRF